MRYLLCCFCLLLAPAWGAITPKTFLFSTEPIDVVIPCAPKDLRTLEHCIKGIRENGKNLRRIIVISKEKLTESAEWFSEDLFPFSKEDIALEIFRGDERAARDFIERPETRIGWVFQQFLKLYAPFVIPEISSNVLILDADVVFLRPIAFMMDDGRPYLTPSSEPYHDPYFHHGARLISGWHRVHLQHSGIAHHMLFQRPILEDLLETISTQHQMEPWKAICRVIDLNDIGFSGMSEYEIYFNYALLRTSQVVLRPLRWTLIHSLRLVPGFKQAGFAFVCYPTWLGR
jgi:hypothetical protein